MAPFRLRRGDAVTGVSAPYEPPATPDLELRTDELTVPESVAKILEYLDLQTPESQVSI